MFLAGLLIGSGLVVLPVSGSADSQSNDLFELSITELLDVTIQSASGIDESLRNAPAALISISAEDIQRRGYQSIGELLQDLPGFDIADSYSTFFNASQRGYRTSLIQRTLLLVNGRNENGLWTHQANVRGHFPLLMVKRVEVLYGPVSAVYGPNAFLGIINIITHDTREVDEDSTQVEVRAGSFDATSYSLASRGKLSENLRYNFGIKHAETDGPDLDDFGTRWGFSSSYWLANEKAWGPILKESNNGRPYGEYFSPERHRGLLLELAFDDFLLGYNWFESEEGYGLMYTFDHAQANSNWHNGSNKAWLEHQYESEQGFKVKTLLQYRESWVNGNYAEANPDWNEGLSDYSYVSISDWNSDNNATLFQQDFEFRLNSEWLMTGGFKHESKTLTKAYDVCGYWAESFCSSSDGSDLGPEGLGAGIFHSSSDVYVRQPGTVAMPDSNLIDTTDKGVYLQGIFDYKRWRINLGLRFDDNSLYGSSSNPRASLVYRWTDRTTIKLLYGTAFQEPAPIQLFGGFSGRVANPDLKPEEAENLEFILMHQGDYVLHDVSFYRANYKNVIKEEAENAGERDITGIEYRGKWQSPHFLDGLPPIEGYLYYSYTHSESAIRYDHGLGQWVDGNAELGDIAPHKWHLGANIPLPANWNANFRLRHIGERDLYLRNPLRQQGHKLDAQTIVDLTLQWRFERLSLSLQLNNLFNEAYYHPGFEQADSGNDFDNRALGFRNSLLPQVETHYSLALRWNF